LKARRLLILICGSAILSLPQRVVCADSVQNTAGVQVTATYENDSPTDIVQISSPYLPSQYNGWYFYAGVSNFNTVSVTTNSGVGSLNDTGLNQSDVSGSLGSNFQGFCVDLSHLVWENTQYTWQVGQLTDIRSPTSPTDVQSNGIGISADQAAAISRMWYSDWEGQAHTDTTAATFQIALWMLLYDYGSPTGPPTMFAGSEIPTATCWASAAWNDTSSPQASIFALVNTDQAGQPGQQQFSIAVVGATPSVSAQGAAVPLPPAAESGFAFLTLLGIFGIVRQVFRKTIAVQ
jgi:hypothetical protein